MHVEHVCACLSLSELEAQVVPSVEGQTEAKVEEQQEATKPVEESIVPETATTTGNDDGNPAHTEALNSSDKPEQAQQENAS